MSKILATYNLDTQTWNVRSSDLQSHCDLEFRFVRNTQEKIVQFQNLQFGFELFHEGSDFRFQTGQYPENSALISSDQEVVQTTALTLGYEVDYSINIWAVNDGIKSDTTYRFSTPRPQKPFESWIWNAEEKRWEAPVAKPSDFGMYAWNEEKQTWEMMQY